LAKRSRNSRVFIEQRVDALAPRQLALAMLVLLALGAAAGLGRRLPPPEFSQRCSVDMLRPA
jgi:hypothetical protein